MVSEIFKIGVGNIFSLYPFKSITGKVVQMVSEIFKIGVGNILSFSKQPERIMARSVLAYWAVRELGIPGTKVGKKDGQL